MQIFSKSLKNFCLSHAFKGVKFQNTAKISKNSFSTKKIMPGMMVEQKSVKGSRPFLIGVCGGTASGKSTVCEEINRRVAVDHPSLVVTICQDSFYRDLNEEEKKKAYAGDFNFDHPDAVDHQLMLQVLKDLKDSKPVKIPKYDYRNHSRIPEESKTIDPADVILVEGILIFYYQDIRAMFDMKLFVDTDPDTRLARRVQRDINDRGRSLQNILHQYLSLVKPAYEEFCLPTKKYADVIIPRGAENKVAIDLIVQHIQEILRGAARSADSHVSLASVGSTLRHSIDSVRPTNRPH